MSLASSQFKSQAFKGFRFNLHPNPTNVAISIHYSNNSIAAPMELLKPLNPHHHEPILRLSLHSVPSSSSHSQVPFPMVGKVYVAVGKSLDKAIPLLRWTLNHFRNAEIVILHAHQPSVTIPTLCKLISFNFQCKNLIFIISVLPLLLGI